MIIIISFRFVNSLHLFKELPAPDLVLHVLTDLPGVS